MLICLENVESIIIVKQCIEKNLQQRLPTNHNWSELAAELGEEVNK